MNQVVAILVISVLLALVMSRW